MKNVKKSLVSVLIMICVPFLLWAYSDKVSAADEDVKAVVRERILTAIDNRDQRVSLSDLFSECTDDVKRLVDEVVYYDILRDYNYFYINGYEWVPGSDSEIRISCAGDYVIECPQEKYILREELIAKRLEAVRSEVDKALACITPKMSDLEKVLALHDWLVLHCEYDYGHYNGDYFNEEAGTEYGALVEKMVVCAGYARTLDILLYQAGIKAYSISGDTSEGEHAWNLVYIDDNWYHVDATWNEMGDVNESAGIRYEYFLKSDEEFKNLSHYEWEVEPSGVPRTTLVDTPKATNSDSFKDYLFRHEDRALNYYDSYYYYVKYYSDTNTYDIVKSKIDGTDMTSVGIDRNIKTNVVALFEGKLYYADGECLYSYNLETYKETLAYDISNLYPGYCIDDLRMVREQIKLWVSSDSERKEKQLWFDINDLVEDTVWAKKLYIYCISGIDATPLLVKGEMDGGLYSFESADPSIATVDSNGMVFGAGEGTTTITIFDNTGNKVSECKVTIDFMYRADEMVLSSDSITFGRNEKEFTKYVSLKDPDNRLARFGNVTVHNSDPSVATVEVIYYQESTRLAITAHTQGTITITVTTEDNFVDTCEIIVESPSLIEGISLDKSGLLIKAVENTVKGSYMKLTATVTPADAYYDIFWNSSDTNVVKVYNGELVPVNDGTAVITVTAREVIPPFVEHTATCQVTVKITEYGGVDYAPVFDYEYYIENNVSSSTKPVSYNALKQFVDNDMRMGVQASPEFNVGIYYNNYPELITALGNSSIIPFYMHYINSGKTEGREAAVLIVTGNGTKYYGVDYSDVYDYEYYMEHNEDLREAFGSNKKAALKHFVTVGMAEGRQGCADFGGRIYKNNYPELQEAFGDDMEKYYIHYMNYGKAEGRNGATYDYSRYCEWEGVNYAPVYNYEDYIRRNPDVYNAFGTDVWAVLEHFVNIGMSEGRQGSDDFNANIYRSNYPDLEDAFGEDMKQYYWHYINSGYNENRCGSTTIYVSDTIHAGVDFAAVYNYDYYITAYPDVAAVLGDNRYATLTHFVRNGIPEGRQASVEFNVYAYMENNSDLAVVYGDDLESYYMHYIEHGREEGRTAN